MEEREEWQSKDWRCQFSQCHGDLVAQLASGAAPSGWGGILHLSPAPESGQNPLDSEMQQLATSDKNFLGHKTEAILKAIPGISRKKRQALDMRVSQGVKITWGFTGNKWRWTPSWGHFTKKRQEARSRAIRDWRAFLVYLSWFPRVTTLLSLKNPWRQAAKSHQKLSYPDGQGRGGQGHVTINEPILMPHCYPKYIVYLEFINTVAS